MEEKSKVKRQESQSAGHQGIEKLMEQRTTLCKMSKRIKALQSTLAASSALHKLRNVKKLEVHVEEVGRILDEIPQAKEQLAHDMATACAWRRYVKELSKPKVEKVEKPVLNTDDLDGMF